MLQLIACILPVIVILDIVHLQYIVFFAAVEVNLNAHPSIVGAVDVDVYEDAATVQWCVSVCLL